MVNKKLEEVHDPTKLLNDLVHLIVFKFYTRKKKILKVLTENHFELKPYLGYEFENVSL